MSDPSTPRTRCVGTTTAGDPCPNWPVRGATVCRMHGAGAPQVRARAAVRAELAAWRLDDSKEDPGEVLLRLVTQSAARVRLYSGLLEEAFEAQAEADDQAGESATVRLPRGVGALVGHKFALSKDGELFPVEEAVRGLAQLEATERDRCAGFAAKAVAAGLAERQVRLAERQAEAMVAAVLLTLGELGLDADDGRVRSVVAGALERVGAA